MPGRGKVVAMSSIQIFDATSNSYNTTSAASAGTVQEVTTPTATAAPTTAATPSHEDTVKISAAAQARLLHQSGESVANIASSLGTSTATVDSYLGIQVTQAIDQALQAAEATATSKATVTATAKA